MAIGDLENFIKRQKSVLPPWFGEEYPLLDAFIKGFSTLDVYCYNILGYVEDQMRIQTSTDSNLDLEAQDYFANWVVRPENMPDATFRKYILATLLQEEATKKGMRDAIFNLTGYYPIIWEPWDWDGSGAYNVPTWGYNTAGAYGFNLPYNFWITVYVAGNPMVNYGGYNLATWGFNAPNPPSNGAYGDDGLYDHTWTYDEILALINRIKVGGTVPHLTVIYL